MSQENPTMELIIATALNIKPSQAETVIRLLDDGATVPFIARYRKEATEGLDDIQLRQLSERLYYLRDLNDRRGVILKAIEEQGKLTEALTAAIQAADTKTRLEDLYLPYRPKRRTKAQLAREAGLEPLAEALFNNPTLNPEEEAKRYINTEHEILEAKTALAGAQQILMEKFGEDPDLVTLLREYLWQHGVLKSNQSTKPQPSANKFTDYFNYAEPIKKIPSHRALALFRGRREGVLQLSLTLPNALTYGETTIAEYFKFNPQDRAADEWLKETIALTWKVKLFTKLELELLNRIRELADEEAIKVFSKNLHDLLLAAPAGSKVTMGLDPGIRTGVKVVVVDATGQLLDYTTVFPLAPQNDWHPSIAALAKLIIKYRVDLISIGNGTGSRETERLVTELMKMYPDLTVSKVLVSEAGASVYSASELASKEFPDLDVTLRGAVSIARRLQDPLAELVKIEPKAIGVGQYQHDVNQNRLAHCLDGVIEDCVNLVGVDVNTASVPLLMRVSGLNETHATNLVEFRNTHGAFKNREQFKEIARFGEKTYQQAAGFLRIMNGDNPLDASSVHPEAYSLVEQIVQSESIDLRTLIGNRDILSKVNAEDFKSELFGLPTIKDVLKELEKPGRDPRPEFKTVQFKDGVEEIKDLQLGMILQGVVSNVTNFGAFVDIGVHQDGLVHISAMASQFIQDPSLIVKAGDIITVRVVEVNLERRRIGLSMKLADTPEAPKVRQEKVTPPKSQHQTTQHKKKPIIAKVQKPKPAKPEPATNKGLFNTAMADALSKLKQGSS